MGSDGGERPRAAFYALRPGGWRDYWTLLHPPYTLWHLSYVAIGAAAAPRMHLYNLAWSLLAFFLGVGVSAHALDELRGRPLGTRIPSAILVGLASVGLAGALAAGVYGAIRVSPWLLAFMAVGALIVPGYNLEWFGGALHSDLVFALGWGGFPALVGYFAQDGRIRPVALAVAAACSLLSTAQRILSTPVRTLRRHVVEITGRIRLDDGTEVDLEPADLKATPEAALRAMWIAIVVLAVALVTARA